MFTAAGPRYASFMDFVADAIRHTGSRQELATKLKYIFGQVGLHPQGNRGGHVADIEGCMTHGGRYVYRMANCSNRRGVAASSRTDAPRS